MKISEMIRLCADQLERTESMGIYTGVTLSIHKGERLPFRGPGVELANEKEHYRTYFVPIATILAHVARFLKAEAQRQAAAQPKARTGVLRKKGGES